MKLVHLLILSLIFITNISAGLSEKQMKTLKERIDIYEKPYECRGVEMEGRYWIGVNADGSFSMINIRRVDNVRNGYIVHKLSYDLIDKEGEVIIAEKDMGIHRISGRLQSAPFRISKQISPDRWLLITTSGHVMFRTTFNTNGDIITKDSISTYEKGNLLLVDAPDGTVYLIENGIGWKGVPYNLRKVYPDYEENIVEFKINKELFNLDIYDYIGTMTTNNHLYLFFRPKEIQFKYKRNEIGYIVLDTRGNIIKPASKINIEKMSFRKYNSAYLAGVYRQNYKAKVGKYDMPKNYINGGMDVVRLKSGDLLFTVAYFDKMKQLGVYQIKIDSQGNIIEPEDARKNINGIDRLEMERDNGKIGFT